MRATRVSRPRLLAASVLLVLVCGVMPIWAHHSFGATFDEKKVVTITGVVTKVQYSNPHSHLFLDVMSPDGSIVPWTFEGYPPVVLYRTGFSPNTTLKFGDTVTVFGWRARDDSAFALGREVTLPSGKHLFFGPNAGTGEGAAIAPGSN